MTIIDATALSKHVLGLGVFGVIGTVFVDVGADIRKKVGAIASLGNGFAQAHEIALMLGELLTEEGQVVLFQSG